MPEYSAEEAAARPAALHNTYSYLLRLAAQKRAADRGRCDNSSRSPIADTPAMEPKAQEEDSTGLDDRQEAAESQILSQGPITHSPSPIDSQYLQIGTVRK
jgi:hypothetical protein